MSTSHFDHEKLRADQEALRFVAWVGPVIEALPKRLAARDQLDRASTSVVLDIAEGNGKRSGPDRCRYLDVSRGSALECAACLDVLVCRGALGEAQAMSGKGILLAVVSPVAGLIGYFAKAAEEGVAAYGEGLEEKEENE